MSEVIYMEVTRDEYSLPLAVAKSPGDLARMLGIRANAISTSLNRCNKREQKFPRFVKVEVEDESESQDKED